MLMTDEHKQLLNRNRDKLVKNIDPDELITTLQSRNVLTSRDVGRIKEKSQTETQVEKLLDIISRKPDSAFEQLVLALEDTDQSHIAEILRG